MWTGSLGLWLTYWGQNSSATFFDFLQTLSSDSLRVDAWLIPWVRLPTVLLAAGCVAVFYWLARKLVGETIAIVGALLLAFDPLFLAHSRTLHHDALATIFISLSVLALLNFAATQKSGARWYLILSGGLAGLALLSKGTSLALVIFATLFFLWCWLGQKRPLKATISAGLIWLGVAMVVFVALWPAMWVIPGQVLEKPFKMTDVIKVIEFFH